MGIAVMSHECHLCTIEVVTVVVYIWCFDGILVYNVVYSVLYCIMNLVFLCTAQ